MVSNIGLRIILEALTSLMAESTDMVCVTRLMCFRISACIVAALVEATHVVAKRVRPCEVSRNMPAPLPSSTCIQLIKPDRVRKRLSTAMKRKAIMACRTSRMSHYVHRRPNELMVKPLGGVGQGCDHSSNLLPATNVSQALLICCGVMLEEVLQYSHTLLNAWRAHVAGSSGGLVPSGGFVPFSVAKFEGQL